MPLRIISLLILSSLFLTACGEKETPVVRNPVPKKVVSQKVTPPVNSGAIVETKVTSTGGVRYEIINGIEVPPEPDPTLNNATLEGVDVNGNGVRDDVERLIITKITDPVKIDIATQFAKSHYLQLAYDLKGDQSDLEVFKLMQGPNINDLQNTIGEELTRLIIQTTYDTSKRKEKQGIITSMAFNTNAGKNTKICDLTGEIFGIIVPPEPAKDNNLTRAGVDSNTNGVRDDVERMIGCNVINANDYLASIEIAKVYQKILLDENDVIPEKKMIDYWRDIACAENTIDFTKYPDRTYSPEYDIPKITFNTEERETLYQKKTSDFGGFLSSELKDCNIRLYSPYTTY